MPDAPPLRLAEHPRGDRGTGGFSAHHRVPSVHGGAEEDFPLWKRSFLTCELLVTIRPRFPVMALSDSTLGVGGLIGMRRATTRSKPGELHVPSVC